MTIESNGLLCQIKRSLHFPADGNFSEGNELRTLTY